MTLILDVTREAAHEVEKARARGSDVDSIIRSVIAPLAAEAPKFYESAATEE